MESKQILPINLNDGLEDFSWEQDSILYKVNAHTLPKEIFQSACDELGKFYKTKGFKYSSSSHKLEYSYSEFKMKIILASSHSNSCGNFVWLEINSGIYPDKLHKQYKAAKERLLPIILTNVDLFNELISDKPAGTVIGVSILGETKEIIDERYSYAQKKYNRGLNLYNISLVDFKKIIAYINRVVEYSFGLVLNPYELINHINRSYETPFYYLKEKRFLDYLNIYHTKESEVYKSFLRKYKELEGKDFQ